MNRRKFIRHLNSYHCFLLRHGGAHDVYQNPMNNCISSVPRHNELNRNTCKAICKQLGIPFIN